MRGPQQREDGAEPRKPPVAAAPRRANDPREAVADGGLPRESSPGPLLALTPLFDCSRKYCRQMVSCAEARFKLTVCGHRQLDRDGDGVPCEIICR